MNKTSYFPVTESTPVWPENGRSLKASKRLEIRVRGAVTDYDTRSLWATSHRPALEYGLNSLTDPGGMWKQRLQTNVASQTGPSLSSHVVTISLPVLSSVNGG